jgi:hypothetical protein
VSEDEKRRSDEERLELEVLEEELLGDVAPEVELL